MTGDTVTTRQLRKPNCVVLDANVWRSELLLKTPGGADLVYALARQDDRIGLPEVIKRELEAQVVEEGLRCATGAKRLNLLADSSAVIPQETDLKTLVQKRLDQLEPILVTVPFTLEHARAALNMVFAKLPPNGPDNQQFKDSAVWQALLQLGEAHNVLFVTNDRAFLADRQDYAKGLAANLSEDCTKLGLSVSVFRDVRDCLKSVSPLIAIPNEQRLIDLHVTNVTGHNSSSAA